MEIKLERKKYQEDLDLAAGQTWSKNEKVKESYRRSLLSTLYDIDHSEGDESVEYFRAEASFTILDWLVQDELLTNKKIKIDNLHWKRRLQLCMNIFPKRKTVLHCFVENCFNLQKKGSSVNNQEVVLALFKTCEKGVIQTAAEMKLNTKASVSFEIPIIEDYYGRTPFDIALNIPGKHKSSQYFKKLDYETDVSGLEEFILLQKETIDNDKSRTSEAMAAILFACTKNYKFLHSAHKISDAIIEAVELKVAGIGEYIQGRLKPPPNLPNLNQRPITSKNGIKGHFMSLNDLGQFVYTEYGAATMEVFSGKEDIEKTFFKDHGATKLMKMQQLDIPYIFLPATLQGTLFIQALNATSEVDLFLLQSVQAIIDRHFYSGTVQGYLWSCIIIPYLAQLSVFIAWSQSTLQKGLEGGSEGERDHTDKILEYVLLGLCIWFLLFEIFKVLVAPLAYFTSPWNLINLVPMILILINVLWLEIYLTEKQETSQDGTGQIPELEVIKKFEIVDGQQKETLEAGKHWYQKEFWNVQAMAALTLWFKFLYVLRSFSRTSYLIRSLVEVTKDMWVFLLVLFIVVIGYGDAFVNLSMADRYLNPGPSDEKRLRHVVEGGYVGAIEYGILELKGNDWVEMSPFAYCVSVTAFVLLLVIMMNLLIAIVSATFERVTSSSVQYSFKEKVGLVSDIYAALKMFVRKESPNKGQKNQYLFIVQESDQNHEAIPDEEEENDEVSTDEKVELMIEEQKAMGSTITTMASDLSSTKEQMVQFSKLIKEIRDHYVPKSSNTNSLSGSTRYNPKTQAFKKNSKR